MIVFNKIKFANFLSTGNTPTEIYLDRVPSVLITGHNGAGKSTILDAITYGLYGKPYRNINKPQLLNTVNDKGLLVELDFVVNSVEFKVIRGIKPGIFEIYRGGTLLQHDAAAKDYQRRLEDIVGMNYKAFTQIVILGSARYQSFMDLGQNDRRTIIEEILDITVFSKMNGVLKNNLTNVELDLKENDYQKEIKSTEINGQKGLIKSLVNREKESKEKIDQQKVKTSAEIKLIQKEVELLDSEISQHQLDNLETLQKGLMEVQQKAKEVSKKAKEHDNRIAFYESTEVCHSCEQTLSEEIKDTQIKKYTKEKEKLKSMAPTIATAISNAEKKVEASRAVHTKVQTLLETKKEKTHSIAALQRVLKDLESESTEQSIEEELEQARNTLEGLEKQKTELEQYGIAMLEERHTLEVCKVLLKDDGIKAKIIKQYLPVMNNLINKFLDRMGANYSFHLDEQFNEVIKSRYRDTFSYASFSEGEKSRIDVALMLTWREIAKLKNSIATNLLILDEIGDSSLDGEGTDALWDILSDAKDTNLFVISHKTSNVDKFTSHIEVYKQGNFSKIRNSK